MNPRHLFMFLCFSGFAGFFGAYLRIPVLPLLASSLGGSAADVGLINASFMLAAGVLSIPAGLAADRIGRRITAVAGLAAVSLSSFLIGICATPLQMAGVYLLFGVGLAAFAPSMMSFVADAAPAGGVGRAYGWYTTSVYTAMTFGPAAGGYLGRHLGLRPVFLVSGGVVACVAVFALFLLPGSEPRPRHTGSVRKALARCLESRSLTAALAVTFGSCFGFGLFISFLALYANGLGLDAAAIGIIFAVQALVNVVSRIPFGRMIDSLPNRRLPVAAGFIAVGAGVATLGAGSGLLSLCLSAALIGIGMAAGYTAVGALVAESVEGELRGLAMGMYNSCIYLGMMCASALVGPVITRFGFAAGFLCGGAATAAAVAFFLRQCPGAEAPQAAGEAVGAE